MASQSEIAHHLGLSTKYLGELLDRGVIERKPRGQYDLDEARASYIANLREVAAGRAANGDLDLGEERARLAKEQADAKEMENSIARGELVYIDDVASEIEKQLVKVKTKLLGVPTKAAPEAHACATVKEVQSLLEAKVVEALNDLVGLNASDTEEGS